MVSQYTTSNMSNINKNDECSEKENKSKGERTLADCEPISKEKWMKSQTDFPAIASKKESKRKRLTLLDEVVENNAVTIDNALTNEHHKPSVTKRIKLQTNKVPQMGHEVTPIILRKQQALVKHNTGSTSYSATPAITMKTESQLMNNQDTTNNIGDLDQSAVLGINEQSAIIELNTNNTTVPQENLQPIINNVDVIENPINNLILISPKMAQEYEKLVSDLGPSVVCHLTLVNHLNNFPKVCKGLMLKEDNVYEVQSEFSQTTERLSEKLADKFYCYFIDENIVNIDCKILCYYLYEYIKKETPVSSILHLVSRIHNVAKIIKSCFPKSLLACNFYLSAQTVHYEFMEYSRNRTEVDTVTQPINNPINLQINHALTNSIFTSETNDKLH